MIVKEPGIVAPPRPPAGGVAPPVAASGAASAAIANRWPVLLSNAMVRAPFVGQVFRFCSTSKSRRALLLDDGHRAVALRAERFHRRRVERRAVGTAGERQPREDLPVLRTQDDKRLRRLGVGIGRGGGPAAAVRPFPAPGAAPTALHAANRI